MGGLAGFWGGLTFFSHFTGGGHSSFYGCIGGGGLTYFPENLGGGHTFIIECFACGVMDCLMGRIW